jgi:hypothetical protein
MRRQILCREDSGMPQNRSGTPRYLQHRLTTMIMLCVVLAAFGAVANAGGLLGYEPAYVNGTTVKINAIEVKQNPTEQAQADLYEVIYPFDPATSTELTAYWPGSPQCNPCDHQGDGITPDDFHDHVLDSQPSNPGHGEYNALWRVYLIMPNYNNDAAHNAAVNAAYQSMLPLKSEADVDALVGTQVDGMPLANEIDTHFYFICGVVGQGAGTHGKFGSN